MPGPNLLIGNGQVLAGAIPREPGGGGNKQYPYTIQEARDRLGPALKQLLADEHFATLLRAEGLDSLPKQLAERVWAGGHPA